MNTFMQKPVSYRKTTTKSGFKEFIAQWDLQILVLPAMIYIIIFYYIPMWGVLFAFQDYDIFKGFFNSDWVGLKHFHVLFNSPDFLLVMGNTLTISFLKLLILFPAPIFLALILNEVRNERFKRIVQTITYLPHFISWVIVAGFVTSILAVDNGSLNLLLQSLGLIKEPISWLSIPKYFRTILIGSGLWKEIGFSSIIYLAAISGIDTAQYEAAEVDGASRVKQIFAITLPNIAPVIGIFLILAIGNLLNAGFEDILVLTNNGANAILRDTSEVIDTYVYKQGLGGMRYSYATCVGLFKSVINIILLCSANLLVKKLGSESLW
ncbi:ABC transporter permease [Clostridium lacusfryxellense]|uniref:ABC transporter permease n=1 Tax=Clostridium lacusfryxellense TaxID=205328 RepID=UPI001FE4264D|nr:ABC transporter permease subunit [Clostridium lacusfryxellense]